MSNWTPQDWMIFLGAIVTTITAIVAVLSPFILNVIKAIKENTAVTVANTTDRAVKTAATNEALSTIQTLVTDIHRGTGDGTSPTVNVTTAPNPPPQA